MINREIKILLLVGAIWLVLITSPLRAQSASLPFTLTGTDAGFGDPFGSLSFNNSGDFAVTVNGIGGTGDTGGIAFSSFFGSLSVGRLNESSNWGSMSFGIYSTASGYASTASGYGTVASGEESFAVGLWTVSSGVTSTAFGNGTQALGWSSTASGAYVAAIGTCSTAFGENIVADSCNSFVIGHYNVGGGSNTTWVTEDPLFEIGNGTAEAPADAVLVQKNGNMTVSGTITAAPGGDIPMFAGY